MQISIVSSLTPEDERRCAAAFFRTICTVLDLLPVAYSVRVTTASGKALTRTHSPKDAESAPAVSHPSGRTAPDEPFPLGGGHSPR